MTFLKLLVHFVRKRIVKLHLLQIFHTLNCFLIKERKKNHYNDESDLTAVEFYGSKPMSTEYM